MKLHVSGGPRAERDEQHSVASSAHACKHFAFSMGDARCTMLAARACRASNSSRLLRRISRCSSRSKPADANSRRSIRWLYSIFGLCGPP
eukprot:6194321-Pleurochrysis_carterae.AAC.2